MHYLSPYFAWKQTRWFEMCAQQPEQCSIVGRGGFWLESGAERAGICRADDLMAVVSSQSKQALTVQGKGDL